MVAFSHFHELPGIWRSRYFIPPPPTSAKGLSYLFVTVSGRSYCVVTVLWVPFKPKAQIYLVTEMMRLSIISLVFSPTSRNQSYQLLMFYDHLGMFTFWCPEIYWDKLLLLYFNCRIRPLYENWNTTTAQQNVSITGLRGISSSAERIHNRTTGHRACVLSSSLNRSSHLALLSRTTLARATHQEIFATTWLACHLALPLLHRDAMSPIRNPQEQWGKLSNSALSKKADHSTISNIADKQWVVLYQEQARSLLFFILYYSYFLLFVFKMLKACVTDFSATIKAF